MPAFDDPPVESDVMASDSPASSPAALRADRTILAVVLVIGLELVLATACATRGKHEPRRASEWPGSSASDAARPDSGNAPLAHGDSQMRNDPRTITVAPLPGWPRWVGQVNHQISGLAYRDGHLYAVSDQSGVEKRALLEILPAGWSPGTRAARNEGERGAPDSGEDAPWTHPEATASTREVDVRVLCRWQGGPHPDAEGLALDPPLGAPRTAVMCLESGADALIEVRFGGCELLAEYGPLTGRTDNQGIEGIALSPDGRTVYLVHETRCTLLVLPRGGPGPARVVARIQDAHSLCDEAYDDRGTAALDDDRLLLLDRNARQIFSVTTSGQVVGRWRFDRDALARDPEGHPYRLVALEALAIESREADGSLLVYAATDTPPPPLPYSRTGGSDEEARYARRIGMLYRFRLPPLE